MLEAEYVKLRPKRIKTLLTRKKILLVTLTVIAILTAITVYTYSRYLYPTGEIIPNLYAIRGGGDGVPMVNFFLIQIDEKYIAFDTGANSNQTENELQKLNISPNDIIAVFITHDHEDHIGSLSLFSNATIYTGLIELTDSHHQIMSDGETIDLYGVSIQSIYTHGHTSGCSSYLVDGRYLFVGDLFVNPNFAQYSTESQILNRKKVLELDEVECVFTGHFGLFKNVRFFRWWFS